MSEVLSNFPHDSVLIDEVICALQPRDGGSYIDGTFGAGGYSRAILESANCSVWAIDRDPEAIFNAASLVQNYSGRLILIEGCFGDMHTLLPRHGLEKADGIMLDLGVSSRQLDDGNRGFSFRHDGPLDMRMEKQGRSAADIVNEIDEALLADILYKNGEEYQARHIARAISTARQEREITRTAQLAEIVRSSFRVRKTTKLDPATKTFQALRIEVNDELGELERGLKAAERLLSPGGRVAVVSFHSLEDRIVKNFLRTRSGEIRRGSRHLPAQQTGLNIKTFHLTRRGAVKPGKAEIKRNPRSRSARMRFAERVADTGKGH